MLEVTPHEHDIISHLQCAGFIETRPFTSNETVVQSNQHQFVSCQLQLHIVFRSGLADLNHGDLN